MVHDGWWWLAAVFCRRFPDLSLLVILGAHAQVVVPAAATAWVPQKSGLGLSDCRHGGAYKPSSCSQPWRAGKHQWSGGTPWLWTNPNGGFFVTKLLLARYQETPDELTLQVGKSTKTIRRTQTTWGFTLDGYKHHPKHSPVLTLCARTLVGSTRRTCLSAEMFALSRSECVCISCMGAPNWRFTCLSAHHFGTFIFGGPHNKVIVGISVQTWPRTQSDHQLIPIFKKIPLGLPNLGVEIRHS